MRVVSTTKSKPGFLRTGNRCAPLDLGTPLRQPGGLRPKRVPPNSLGRSLQGEGRIPSSQWRPGRCPLFVRTASCSCLQPTPPGMAFQARFYRLQKCGNHRKEWSAGTGKITRGGFECPQALGPGAVPVAALGGERFFGIQAVARGGDPLRQKDGIILGRLPTPGSDDLE